MDHVKPNQTADGNILGTAPIGKLLMKFAIPSIVAMLVSSLYNIVDQIYIGQYMGVLGIGATTVAFPISTITLAMSLLIGAGGNAAAAIKLGEQRKDKAEQIMGNAFALLMAASTIFAVVCLIFLTPVLNAFGATPANAGYAAEYSTIILCGLPFMAIGIGMPHYIRTDGHPQIAMISMITGALLNVVFDPLLIFTFDLGLTGAAIATVFSQIVTAVIVLYYLFRKANMRMRIRNMRLRISVLRTFLLLGIASCVAQVGNTVLQIALNNSLGYYGEQEAGVGGDVAISAMGAVLKVSAILIGIIVGISTGVQPILGYNKGAGHFHRVKRAYLLAAAAGTAVSFCGFLMALFFPSILVSVFGTGNEAFIAFASTCMRIFNFGIFWAGFQIISANFFQSTGQPLKASLLSMSRQGLLLIPLVLILPLFFGLYGILYAGPVADTLAGLISIFFISREMKRLDRLSLPSSVPPNETGTPETAGVQ